nr:MAG TPA: Malate dehydrogenase enzyme [Caudoviricetes sp.]
MTAPQQPSAGPDKLRTLDTAKARANLRRSLMDRGAAAL